MQLSKIRIQNYRLLIDAELEVDSKTTLIVGRNNTAKTSLFECVGKVIRGIPFSFNDYPLSRRTCLYTNLIEYLNRQIDFKDLINQVKPITVEFYVSYSLDDPDENLGALSAFIIDVDEDTTTALIRIICSLRTDEHAVSNKLKSSCCDADGNLLPADDFHFAIANIFKELFVSSIYAVNPKNEDEKQLKTFNDLSQLFPIQIIQAERRLGEDGTRDDSLSTLIVNFFDGSEEEFSPDIVGQIVELRNTVRNNERQMQQNSNRILSSLVSKAVGFGYPNGEELQLGVLTKLDIDEQIKRHTQLTYTAEESGEQLPSEYNGLGYKNLIKMEFLLASFANSVETVGDACIPLLFIEEPESHMHPQMQRAFAEYLENYLAKVSSAKIQTFLTSHSAHITNTMEFSKIRYAKKTKFGVTYKNLNTFAKKHPSNTEFIRKYLTLTKCDLFFADKAILVEGASERLLLPDMIEKCANNGDFDSQEYRLCDQYYSVIEIGGAFAYVFLPFVEFLDIPCLIITDIDPVKRNKGNDDKVHYISAQVSQGETTSNETIKRWIRTNGVLPDNTSIIPLDRILSMSSIEKTRNRCHIEFQTKEDGLCGRSLEEAIRNVNRSYYKLGPDIAEDDIKFSGTSKTDFALELISECNDYVIPDYIRCGLQWLNDQSVLE